MPQTVTRSPSARRNGGGRAGRPTAAPRKATKPAAAQKATKPTAARKTKPAAAQKATKPAAAQRATAPGRSGSAGRQTGHNGSGPAGIAKELIPSMGHGSPVRTLARHVALRVVRKMARGTLEDAAGTARQLTARAAAATRQAVDQLNAHRLPIQCSVDVAVPIRVAWKEWMALDHLPEGVHTVTDIDRTGDKLTGRCRGGRWRAEIIDERPQESFAWRSLQGSDCAGLITFHPLSDRLTRLELNLDVLPTTGAEMGALSTHLADRRAQRDLRKFKARVELINPDVYKEA